MGFTFCESLREDYASDGYVIFRQILPPALIADLRRVTDRGRELARRKGGRGAQRFEPVANWDIDQRPFEDYRDLPILRDAIRRLFSPRHTYGNREIYLGVFIEPAEQPYCIAWHQDWRHFFPASRPFLSVEAKRDPDLFNQINCALYRDDCTWVVPGSHVRDDTPAEREAFPEDIPPLPCFDEKSSEERERICLDYCRLMPGATRLHLDPGDLCVYRNTLWHMASYVPYVKRATILDVIDTPAYLAWRRSFGFDEEAAKATTTRSVDGTSAEPDTPQPAAGATGPLPAVGGEQALPGGEQGQHSPTASPSSIVQAGDGEQPLPAAVHGQLARAIAQETAGAWTLVASVRHRDRVLLRIQSGDRGVVDVEIERAEAPGTAAFRILDGVAFRYLDTGYAMSKADLHHLDGVARRLRQAAVQLTANRR